MNFHVAAKRRLIYGSKTVCLHRLVNNLNDCRFRRFHYRKKLYLQNICKSFAFLGTRKWNSPCCDHGKWRRGNSHQTSNHLPQWLLLRIKAVHRRAQMNLHPIVHLVDLCRRLTQAFWAWSLLICHFLLNCFLNRNDELAHGISLLLFLMTKCLAAMSLSGKNGITPGWWVRLPVYYRVEGPAVFEVWSLGLADCWRFLRTYSTVVRASGSVKLRELIKIMASRPMRKTSPTGKPNRYAGLPTGNLPIARGSAGEISPSKNRRNSSLTRARPTCEQAWQIWWTLQTYTQYPGNIRRYVCTCIRTSC